jgi:16S rRNA (guanine966-N2)-methyltransferase
MRVVGGSARGRLLRPVPRGAGIRPTGDRVRESVFDLLQGVVDFDGTTVVDLFAGTGALGIEALSRGATHATFVDNDPAALALVRGNLDALGYEGTVVRADARYWSGSADVAFADPPYAFDDWPALFERLDADVLVAESDREIDLGPRWELLKRKRYGSTVVLVARLDVA